MAKAKAVIKDIFDEIEAANEGQETLEATDIWGSRYLPIQWQNPLGLWEAVLELWGGSMLELLHEVSQVRHGSKMIDGFLLESISIAPFAIKIHWGYKDASGKYIMAKEPLDKINPWRSRVHILALMKEAEDLTPVIITAGSNTGKHLLANIGAGQRRIKNMLKRIGRPNVPAYLFWMEMVAGKPMDVGEGEETSTICPPVAPAPQDIHKMTPKAIAKYLTDLYVGHNIRDLFNDGLLAEGQEWSVKQPERLVLSDGNGGNGNALPAPSEINVSVLPDGLLWFPDLSAAKQPAMIDCGFSAPGLFEHREHAANAFAKVVRENRLGGADNATQWEAWRVEIEACWADKMAQDIEIAREIEERGVMAPTMDEIEADAEIPPAFR